MSSASLSQAEAERLLSMLKCSLVHEMEFPQRRHSIEIDAFGDTKKDLFTIKFYRGKVNPLKYEIGARIKKNGTLLLELHINPSNVHPNPDGQKIVGSHWHVYTEKYGRHWAFPAEDLKAEDFIKNTILFFDKFNIIEQPEIVYQMEL